MRLNGRKLAANTCLLLSAILFTMLASTQLSSQVGGPVSAPLDTDLNGLNSNVAPIPSSTIEPGANSLLTPDEHVLPYDAIGASIVATPLNPVTLSNALSRVPFQVDSSLRDASIITGLHPAPTGGIVDIITRKSAKSGASSLRQSSRLNFSASTQSSLASLHGNSSGFNSSSTSQQSFWRVGASSPVVQASQQSGTASSDINELSLQNKNRVSQAGYNSAPRGKKERDYSTSPLEKVATADQGSTDTSASPFGGLDQKSFLDPDITSPVYPHKASTRRAATLFTGRSQSGSFTRRSYGFPDRGTKLGMRDRGTSNKMSGLTNLSPGTRQAGKPKWHNPILQQMEAEANSVRQ